MRLLPFLAALVMLALAPAARAQDTPVVVELYTSQGCSACPPADALLAELAEQDGVIALALHVDYWDYLGWEDSFARAEFTARQRAYAKKARSRTIYTPQMIVQGEDRLAGSKEDQVRARIAERRGTPPPVRLEVERDGSALDISLEPIASELGPTDVHVVTYIPSQQVAIEAGENAGHEITYTNIVTDWETVATWDGAAPVEMRYEGVDDTPGAVIVQRDRMGPVLTAARF
jgi:hypothetical protein